MSNYFKHQKIFNIAFSILVAFSLWVYVITVENPTGSTTLDNISIIVQGEDALTSRGLMVAGLSRDTFNLQLVGQRSALLKLSEERENIAVVLDVSSITEAGEYDLLCKVTLPSTVTAGNVSISDKNNYTVTVDVALQTSKSVDVTGEFNGKVADGYQADAFVIVPSTIQVTGEADHIDQIDHAVVTVTEKELAETFNGDLPFSFVDQDGQVLTGLNVDCDVDSVYVILPIVRVAEIPLKVNLIPGGGATADDASYTIEPSSIVVSGEDQALSDLTELVLGEIDLSEVVDQQTYTFQIQLPSDISNESGITSATVTVTMDDLPKKYLTVTQIECTNVPSGCTATLVTQSVQVCIRGSSEELALVTADQISIAADLSGLSASSGQYRVDANVTLNNATGVGVVDEDYSVSVQIKKK